MKLQTQQSDAAEKDRLIEKLLKMQTKYKKEEILAEKVATLWSEDVKKDKSEITYRAAECSETELSDVKRAELRQIRKHIVQTTFDPVTQTTTGHIQQQLVGPRS